MTSQVRGRSDDWMKRAACRDHDPDIWYPERHDWRTVEKAKTICRSCPVRSECLAYAKTHHEEWGIWGGRSFETEQESLCAAGLHEKTRETVYVVDDHGTYRVSCRVCDGLIGVA